MSNELAFHGEHAYARLLAQLREHDLGGTHIVGIRRGGAWIAERLHQDLSLTGEIGAIDISFYRDDFARIGLHPEVRATEIPFDVDSAAILLVDDVLFTGRTIRAAMNVLFDYGRPARIDLAVLIDRGGRELPVAPRWAGITADVPSHLGLVLERTGEADARQFTLSIEERHHQNTSPS